MKFLYLVQIKLDVTNIYNYVSSELSCYIPVKDDWDLVFQVLEFIDELQRKDRNSQTDRVFSLLDWNKSGFDPSFINFILKTLEMLND